MDAGAWQMDGPSVFSLIAAGLYGVVGALGTWAAWCAQASAQRPRHTRMWLMVALIFALLALSRILMAEEYLREWLRALLEREAMYGQRRSLQLPLSLLAMTASLGTLLWWIALWRGTAASRRERMAHLARLGMLGMGALIVLRTVSLHGIDTWLYSGPRLNWWLDIGSSLVVGLAARRYALLFKASNEGD